MNYTQESGATSAKVPMHVIRLQELLQLTKLSKSTVYSLMQASSPARDPSFPTGFLLSRRTRAWFQGDVIAWLESRHSQAAKSID